MLRIMQERTRHERNPLFFGYFFHEFLQPDVYIPRPPITMHSLRKQIYFSSNDTTFYPLLQKEMITYNVCNVDKHSYLELCLYKRNSSYTL